MARVSYTDFKNSYLVSDGDVGNEINLNKSPEQLKIELDQVSNIVDILIGNTITPWITGFTYKIDDYVSHNGSNWRAKRANNSVTPVVGLDWELVLITAAGSGGGSSVDTRKEEFIAIEDQVNFTCMGDLTNSAVYIDGVLLQSNQYEVNSNVITLNDPCQAGDNVTIFYTAISPTELIKHERFVATNGQTVITTSGALVTPGVYINGVLQDSSTYTAVNHTLTFLNSLVLGDVVMVYYSVPVTIESTEFAVISEEFICTENQSIFNTPYTPGMIDVLRNGAQLSVTDYTAINGTSIILNVPGALHDIVIVRKYQKFSVANTYSKSEVDVKFSSVLINYITATSDIVLHPGDFVFVNSTLGPINITLPQTPGVGDKVYILDISSSFDINPVTVLRNNKNIMGLSQDKVLNIENSLTTFIFSGIDWRII